MFKDNAARTHQCITEKMGRVCLQKCLKFHAGCVSAFTFLYYHEKALQMCCNLYLWSSD